LKDFITVARVVKPQGRIGEVSVDLHTDFPERFAQRRKLFAVSQSGARRELVLEDFWQHKGRLVMKFAGVDSISDAEQLVGCEIQIPREQRAELTEGETYVGDLVGCSLIADGREIGAVADVIFGAGEAPLLSVRAAEDDKRELLIPFVEQYVRSFDVNRKRLEMQLPDGMLELDAPLSAEEKRVQQNPKSVDREERADGARNKLK
jgi:16S rRNA processing protein RimM